MQNWGFAQGNVRRVLVHAVSGALIVPIVPLFPSPCFLILIVPSYVDGGGHGCLLKGCKTGDILQKLGACDTKGAGKKVEAF